MIEKSLFTAENRENAEKKLILGLALEGRWMQGQRSKNLAFSKRGNLPKRRVRKRLVRPNCAT